MASTTSGVTYSPAALDPWPIETELAKTAYNQPEQQTLMDQYWFERQAAKNLYGEEVQANRDLQQQQMVNALKQKLIEQAPHAGQVPGVAEALQGYGAGYTPEVLAVLHNAAAEKARAENLAHTGTAVSGFSTAGMPGEGLTSLTGIPGFGVRPDIQIAGIHEAGANARAAAAAAKEKDIAIAVPGTENGAIDQATGLPVRTVVRFKPGTPDEEVQRRVNDARRMSGLAQLPGSGIPGVSASQSPMNAPNTTPTTRLGPAKPSGSPATSAQPTQGAPVGAPFPQGTPFSADQASQDRARAGLRTLPPALVKYYGTLQLGNNVPVAMNGGKLHYMLPGGKVGPAVP